MNVKDRVKYLDDNEEFVKKFFEGYRYVMISDLGLGGESVLAFEDIQRNVELLKKESLNEEEFHTLCGTLNTRQDIINFLDDYETDLRAQDLYIYMQNICVSDGKIKKGPKFMKLVDFIACRPQLHFVTITDNKDNIVVENIGNFQHGSYFYIAKGFHGYIKSEFRR